MNLNNKTIPLVSIGMAVYNGQKTLYKSLSTLVNQKYRNIEISIYDDCSNDKSVEIANDFCKKYSFVNLKINSRNIGSHGNIQQAIVNAKGKYFLYASQDDFWDKDFIEVLVSKLQQNTLASAAMSATKIIDENGKEIEVQRLYESSLPENNSNFSFLLSILTKKSKGQRRVKNNHFIHGIVKTSFIKEAFTTSSKVLLTERVVVFQLALMGEIIYCDKVLFIKTQWPFSTADRKSKDPWAIRRANAKSLPLLFLSDVITTVMKNKFILFHKKIYIFPIVLIALYDLIILRLVKRLARKILPIMVINFLKSILKVS